MSGGRRYAERAMQPNAPTRPNIALQLYTVRNPLKDDLPGTLAQVKQAGYTHVEIGPFGHAPEDVAAKGREAGLTPFSSHEGSLADVATAKSAVALAEKLGLEYVVQPWLAETQRSPEGYACAAERLVSVASGKVVTCYHNHDFEFKALPDGRTGWAVMFENPKLHAQMDVCWTAVAGFDPVEEMKKLSGRIPMLHIKDCSDFEKRTLTEVGTGKVPLREVVAAAPACGVKYLIVEQDEHWIEGDPFKSIRISLENLRKMM